MRTISCGYMASVMTMFIAGLLVLAVHNVKGLFSKYNFIFFSKKRDFFFLSLIFCIKFEI